MRCRRAPVAAALLLLAPLCACRGPILSTRLGVPCAIPRSATVAKDLPTRLAPQPAIAGPPAPAPRPGKVSLRAEDLAGVDAWLDHRRNPQWILADHVEILASREYFSQALTLNRDMVGGLIRRTDTKEGDDTVVTLTFLGEDYQMTAMSNPRALVGTGFTITARRSLTLRLRPTRDSRMPVFLRVVANGRAAQGRHEDVLARSDQMIVGGNLRYDGGRWVWGPFAQ
jgi:hypothetical protein